MISVTVLGINSALPAYGRHPTSQIVHLDDKMLMVDCGEGTQLQMSKYHIKRGKLNHIFISHLHGDHYLGITGLINTLSLTGRTADLHLYAPAPLEEILKLQFEFAHTTLHFPLHFHALPEGRGLLVDEPDFSVSCFPTEHRVPCHGFVIREKKNPRKIIPEKLQSLGVPFSSYAALQQGADYRDPAGKVIPNASLTEAAEPGKSYAFCADTRYIETFLPDVEGVNMIYHETTYLDDMREKAWMRYHSTSKQAAAIALKAHVHQLLIGHFSSQYEHLEPFLLEAQSVFPHTLLAQEGETYEVQ